MAAMLCVWKMSTEPAKAEPAIQSSSTPASEGVWIPDARFTFLKMGYCARIYRCGAPGQVQTGAGHFTASSSKKQLGLCMPGVDSLDYRGLCQTDAPKDPCTYDLK